MRILLTGSAGFIGRHVAAELRRRGHTVQGVDAFVQQVHGHSYAVEPWEFASSVANHAIQWAKDTHEVYDAVIHLAAEVGVGQSQYQPGQYVKANSHETAVLWDAILKRRSEVRKVVVASSMSIYGEGEYVLPEHPWGTPIGLIRDVARGWDEFSAVWRHGEIAPFPGPAVPKATRETKSAEPASVYAMSKYDTERYSVILGEAYKIPTVALRFFNVIGPGQSLSNPYTGVAAGFACRTLNGEAPLVFEDGNQTRDFVCVQDVARAVCDAAEAPDVSGVFNVCTGQPTSIGELAQAWCRIARKRGFGSVEPQILNQYRSGDVRHCIGDPTAIRDAIGWEAQWTLPSALADLADWIIDTKQHLQKPQDQTAHAVGELRERGLVREVA